MTKDNDNRGGSRLPLEQRRRLAEGAASFGLLLIAVALVAPFANMTSADFVRPFKWVFLAGAVIYLAARCVNVAAPGESFRLRRLRRLQAWSGVAFGFAAFFWFYSESHLKDLAGPLAILRNTVLFSLIGALLQIASSWMLSARLKKEGFIDDEKPNNGRPKKEGSIKK